MVQKDPHHERKLKLMSHALRGDLSEKEIDAALKEVEDPNLFGRKSADKVVKENRIEDPALASLVNKHALSFPAYMEANLYGQQGLFEREIDFQRTMPLCPQLLSPWFGRAVGELLYASYISASWPFPKDPTFLSLGAGRGYLDHDLIDYYTSPAFMEPEYLNFHDKVQNHSRFIVSDRTDKGVAMLSESLTPLIRERGLGDRIDIRKINALDFALDKKPFGVVYTNELLDCLPVEPVIREGGKDYKLAVVPYTEGKSKGTSDYHKKMGDRFMLLKNRVLTQDEFTKRLETGDTGDIRLHPVLLPLASDQGLHHSFTQSKAAQKNIESPDFGGVYPHQVGVGRVLDSVQRSFDHGVVLLTDYVSSHQGQHNWNMAVNTVGTRRLGKEDVDFQVDFDQVVEEGEKRGMQPEIVTSQADYLEQSLPHVQLLGERDFRRWAKVNDVPGDMPQIMEKAMLQYSMIGLGISQHYKMLVMKW